MAIKEYFDTLSLEFNKAYGVAKEARLKGFDPKEIVEIYPAPDLASRVEGLIGIEGLAEIIRTLAKGQSRSKLAFNVVEEICKDPRFDTYELIKRIELAVRVGAAILTEGVLVAPTEGITGIKRYKNYDGTDYIAVLYAGPIRGAGGTSAALSVALADYARRIFGIGRYKPTMDEVERYVEEAELYHTRAARLQYKPSDDDLRTIVNNCPVCVDGVSTENLEVGVHANIKRITYEGKEVMIPNRVRGGVPLVLCEGIAQKAKKLMKEVKPFGLEWDWLGNIIKIDIKKSESEKQSSTFLDELVAGRPILAYPDFIGGFRLRYGRSRMTGIASKGFNPATMILTLGFIAVGTQLKVEFPGKGCIAVPVDSIEGPFVRLKSGEALRINDAESAIKYKEDIESIISIGDMLVTFGDFRKSNSQLKPTSYVEEYWEGQLAKSGFQGHVDNAKIGFDESYRLSLEYGVPIHPKFLFEFQAVSGGMIRNLAMHIIRNSEFSGEGIYDMSDMRIGNDKEIKRTLELLNVPHRIEEGRIFIKSDFAKSLVASLGFVDTDKIKLKVNELVTDGYDTSVNDALSLLGKVSAFQIPKRSTYIGARIGRPEKAKERLMKPALNVLFPVGSFGGRDRNITSAYTSQSRKFRSDISVEIARYRCRNCKRIMPAQFCYDCEMRTAVERSCTNCGSLSDTFICGKCGSGTVGYEIRGIDIEKIASMAMKKTGLGTLPKVIKGVKGMMNRDKVVEPLEKGILRTINGVYIFKDGTARFDATDVPITHFYPNEIGVSVEKLRELGYDKDCLGNDLCDGEQLVELKHQDVLINRHGAEYMLKITHFVDAELEKIYGLKPFYNAATITDLVGKLTISLSPHTSCGVLNRIIGFTEAYVGFAHPYTISARRRNCDGDEDTTMLLLDALINFSREFLPQSVGGTMDTPLILTVNLDPREVDDEVHAMETVSRYPMEFYEKTLACASPGEVKIECVEDRLGTEEAFRGIMFTHGISSTTVRSSPKRSTYTTLKTMNEKVEAEFRLMSMLECVDIRDAARKVITSHFMRDLIGNMHSFSNQQFRCSVCNAKYRRVPIAGVCAKEGGKLLLTISKGSIEKYLDVATGLADRYGLDNYIKQRLYLIKMEIDGVFSGTVNDENMNSENQQFSLMKFM